MHPNTGGTTPDSSAKPMSGQLGGQGIVSSQSRKFRSIKTLLLALIVLAGIGGGFVFSVFLSRLTWHTVLSDGKPGSLVIAVDCPDN